MTLQVQWYVLETCRLWFSKRRELKLQEDEGCGMVNELRRWNDRNRHTIDFANPLPTFVVAFIECIHTSFAEFSVIPDMYVRYIHMHFILDIYTKLFISSRHIRYICIYVHFHRADDI